MAFNRCLFFAASTPLAVLSHSDDDLDTIPFWDLVMQDRQCTDDIDCGFPGISADECHARGCCFEAKGDNWCSGVASKCASRADCSWNGECNAGTCACDSGFEGLLCERGHITKVHVIQSCHLDVGFTDLSAGVINKYFTHHIPKAIQTANDLRNNKSNPEGWRMKFLAQSFYLGLYLDCPPNMGFTCPTADEQDALRQAIKDGDITWHAFPHNAELENTSPVMLDEGLKATKALDDAFGLPSKRTLSQRDVPGVPRSVIPVLKKNGVDLLSVGVNGASMYPRVPKIFRWRDPISGEEIVAMWHPKGYGGTTKAQAVTIPGWNEAFVTDWIGDNLGPGSAKHYINVFEKVQAEFPQATIVASTFEDYMASLEKSGLIETLPVVESEVGDSWIYGVPSDPKKTAQARALDRAVTRYLAAGGARDAPYLNFTRLAIKNCEHTWGRDVKKNLHDNTNWDNAGFEWARTVGPNRSEYNILEESWWEERRWGFEYPLQALPEGHDLSKLAEEEIGDITQPVPFGGMAPKELRAAGFEELSDVSEPITCGSLEIAFDAKSGAVAHLVDSSSKPPTVWASEKKPLFAMGYRTYSQQDFTTFQRSYSNLTKPPDWFTRDFGKPNETISTHAVFSAKLSSAWMRVNNTEKARSTTFLLTSRIVDNSGDATFAHKEYGAPEMLVMQLVVKHHADAGSSGLEATIWSVNKTSTRLPETMFISFTPNTQTDATKADPLWEMKKLGQWQRTEGDVVAGGSKHLHGIGIGGGFRFSKTGADGIARSLEIEAMDAPVINLGEPLGFPIPCEEVEDPWDVEPDLETFGVSSVFWNNLWGTNYVQWYPFNRDFVPVAGEEIFISRYNLRFDVGASPAPMALVV